LINRRLLASSACLALSLAAIGAMGSPATAQSGSDATTVTHHTTAVPVRPGQAAPQVTSPRITARPKAFATPQATVTSPAPTIPDGTLLPVDAARSIVVDQSDSRLFINSGGGADVGLVSTGLDGKNPVTLYAGRNIYSMALDETNHRLYAALYNPYQIAVVDTTTFTQVHLWDTYNNAQVGPIAYAGGKVWFYDYWLAGTVNATEIQAIDVSTGAHDEVPVPGVTGVSSVDTVPGRTDTLSLGVSTPSGTAQQWFSVAGETLTAGTVLPAGCANQFTSDGTHILCNGTLRKASDLSADGTYATSFGAVGAASADGMAYAGGSCQDTNPVLSIVRNGEAGPPTRSYHLDNSSTSALAYSADGDTLYAITRTLCGTAATLDGTLRVITNPNLVATTLSLTVKPRTAVGATATVTGSLAFQGEPYSGTHPVHVTRTDNAGVHVLPDVTPSASGAFTIADPATPLGLSTYTATFAADGAHDGATTSAGTTREVAWDVNDDGYADAVVGAPGEDIGSFLDAGTITVMYGHAAGVTGTGSVAFDQDTAGVPGGNESGDEFGYTSTSADFNRDGYPDVAVSGVLEDSGSAKDAGAIWIFYGSATGLSHAHDQMITVANTIFGDGASSSGAGFGEALAAGDFNGDGLDDLAAAAEGLNHVIVMYGTASGINTDGQSMSYLQPGSGGVPDSLSTFGWSLSAGDVNGDGNCDLAIGSPFDYKDKNYSVGSVAVVYGNATYGLSLVTGSQRFTPDTTGVPGASHTFGDTDLPDSFGWQVVLADFNGDGKADLAIGAPGTPVTNTSKHEDAGTVTVLLSSGTQIGTTGAVLMSQDTASVPGSPGLDDELGGVMAAGDTNGDHKADLAAYSVGDHYVTVVRGSSTGLSFGTSYGWTQGSPSIPGTSETGDDWGGSLRFENFKGAGAPQDMMVGASGENTGQGAVTFIYGTSSGLTGTGSASFSQNSSGVPGTAEDGDGYGTFYSY
jgi:hypothetical protein